MCAVSIQDDMAKYFEIQSVRSFLNGPIPTSFCLFSSFSHDAKQYKFVKVGLEPGAAGWKAQTNPLSYGGTPNLCDHCGIKKMNLETVYCHGRNFNPDVKIANQSWKFLSYLYSFKLIS